MTLTNLKIHSIAVLGLVTIFVGATIAEAGLAGGDRMRPGQGFHNRHKTSSSSYSRSRQQRFYPAPQAVQSKPAYRSTPKVVTQPQRVAPRPIYRQSWFGGRLFR